MFKTLLRWVWIHNIIINTSVTLVRSCNKSTLNGLSFLTKCSINLTLEPLKKPLKKPFCWRVPRVFLFKGPAKNVLVGDLCCIGCPWARFNAPLADVGQGTRPKMIAFQSNELREGEKVRCYEEFRPKQSCHELNYVPVSQAEQAARPILNPLPEHHPKDANF